MAKNLLKSLIFLTFAFSFLGAQIPERISFQGVLADSSGPLTWTNTLSLASTIHSQVELHTGMNRRKPVFTSTEVSL